MTSARASSSAYSSPSTSSSYCGRSRSRFSGSGRSVTAARSSTAPPSPPPPTGSDPGPDGNRARGKHRHEIDLRPAGEAARSRQGGRTSSPPGIPFRPGAPETVRQGEGFVWVRRQMPSTAAEESGEGGEAGALRPRSRRPREAVGDRRHRTVEEPKRSTRTGNWPRPSSASPTSTARGWRESSSP